MKAWANQRQNLASYNCSYNRLPFWFRQELVDERTLEKTRLLSKLNVNTVCREAKCPNLSYCFKNSKLTFMILGDVCSRNCQFCNVKKSDTASLALDLDEPFRIARTVKELSLTYVVITSVTRDDLEDGGASIFAKTIKLIRNINPVRDKTPQVSDGYLRQPVSNGVKIEILIPDFKGDTLSLKYVLDAHPDVVAHNIETVSRLYRYLRPNATYQLSLEVLKKIKELRAELISKSSIMLGLGETEGEVIKTLEDLKHSQCDIVTLGQYLAPSARHYPIKEFITPQQFQRYKEIGLALGFKAVLSGPLVRSSYQAEIVYREFAYA